MAQTSYNFYTNLGEAGGIADISPKAIVSRANGETGTAMAYGLGVVTGTAAGKEVVLPTSSSTAATFEGVVVNDRIHEQSMAGAVVINPKDTLGVMTWGRVWAQVKASLTIGFGDALYLIVSGANAGKFSNVSSDGIAIKGKFLGEVGSQDTALIELFNQAQEVPAQS